MSVCEIVTLERRRGVTTSESASSGRQDWAGGDLNLLSTSPQQAKLWRAGRACQERGEGRRGKEVGREQ